MFDRTDYEGKLQPQQQRTASHFSTEGQEESFSYQVQAEREYVMRLKLQREKIEGLYSKYDVLLKELKSKEMQIKEKGKAIIDLQSKCKTLLEASEEAALLKKQNVEIKSQNFNLQRALSEMEESYTVLHGHLRSKQAMSSQQTDQLQTLNEELIAKIKTLSRKSQEREVEFNDKNKEMVGKFEEFKVESKREREANAHEISELRCELLRREEENNGLRLENECLRERLGELELYSNEKANQYEERMEKMQKDKRCQLKVLKTELDSLRQLSDCLEKKWLKTKEQSQLKDLSLKDLTAIAEDQEKRSNEAIFLLKQQHTQERNVLKEQLIHCQNHIAKLQRRLGQSLKKQQTLYGKIRKYEVCIDAKRNLREVEKEELEKINFLLSLE